MRVYDTLQPSPETRAKMIRYHLARAILNETQGNPQMVEDHLDCALRLERGPSSRWN